MEKSDKNLRNTAIIGLALIVSLTYTHFMYKTFAMPLVGLLRWYTPSKSAYMKLYDGNKKIRHTYVPLKKISKHLQNAVIIAEDGRFFEHEGIDPEAVRHAIKLNRKKGKNFSGASTITMQLARNLYLNPNKSLYRKIKEAQLALVLDQLLSKERILELYLNFVEWGDGIYGAEAAARHYFQKPAAELDKEEAAFLAAILPRPRFYESKRTSYLQKRIGRIRSLL